MGMMRRIATPALGLVMGLTVGCASAGPAAPRASAPAAQPSTSGRAKALTVGIVGTVPAFSIAAPATSTGGWASLAEIHSEGLVSTDVDSPRLVPRLATRVPTLDDGSITLLADGRMRVAFDLRRDVTWQDGVAFTAQDLAFSYVLGGPNGIPTTINDATKFMDSVEAPADNTFVVYYKEDRKS